MKNQVKPILNKNGLLRGTSEVSFEGEHVQDVLLAGEGKLEGGRAGCHGQPSPWIAARVPPPLESVA